LLYFYFHTRDHIIHVRNNYVILYVMFGVLLACISKNDIESCFKYIFYEFSCSKEAEACIKPAIETTK